MLGYILMIAAAVAAVIGIFVLRQKAPVLGPDGCAVVLGGWILAIRLGAWYSFVPWWMDVALLALLLMNGRVLWGWLRSRCSVTWFAAARLSGRWSKSHHTLLTLVGWIVLWGAVCLGAWAFCWQGALPFAFAAALGAVSLWSYGKALEHFSQQLENFRAGLPICVREGAFSRTETLLQQLQKQQEEAIRTAVTSERFKVELIANVSHDLRTPLTSILGYSELLHKESLSEQGQTHLQRLHQKAGYMNELVESLFELTKVSSGAVQPKTEELDLLRLLEQTIGLMDDSLTEKGLCVKRHYTVESARVRTDGARMHQVFANLLGNAIKYALSGTRIHLEVREDGDTFRVRMVNTAAYEMDFQPEEVLQRFARGDKARTTKGSGLGLAIAKTYTESVGGSFHIGVDGDQFSATVVLPKAERDL